jgi:hypothetical protein
MTRGFVALAAPRCCRFNQRTTCDMRHATAPRLSFFVSCFSQYVRGYFSKDVLDNVQNRVTGKDTKHQAKQAHSQRHMHNNAQQPLAPCTLHHNTTTSYSCSAPLPLSSPGIDLCELVRGRTYWCSQAHATTADEAKSPASSTSSIRPIARNGV